MLNEDRESRDEDDLLLPRVKLFDPPTILSKEGLEVLGASFCCWALFLSWMPPVEVRIRLSPPWAALPGPIVA